MQNMDGGMELRGNTWHSHTTQDILQSIKRSAEGLASGQVTTDPLVIEEVEKILRELRELL